MTGTGGLYGLGVDPGASAGLGLVFAADATSPLHREDGLPYFVGAWGVWGAGHTRRLRRDVAIRSAFSTARECPVRGCVESPAGGGASARRNGWQFSVGRSAGRFEADIERHVAISEMIAIVPGNVWPKALGVRYGKRGDGWHRVEEASHRVANPLVFRRIIGEKAETKAGIERQVCLAEATLIAIYAVSK